MVLVSLFKLEGGKVTYNDWLASVWSVYIGLGWTLYSVVEREKDSAAAADSEVAGRQWCRLKRVFPLSE